MRKAKPIQVIATHVVLVIIGLLFLAPALWMVLTSLKTNSEALASPPVLIPQVAHIENYGKAFAYDADKLGFIPFLAYGRNSILLALLVVIGTVSSNAVVAYAFAKLRWPGRDVVFALTLATMMVPFPVLMVPLFGLFKNLGWLGSFKPLWVPAFFGSAFNIFLLRQFFRTIPNELSEAARLDGLSEWNIFLKVVVPLSKPALIVVGLFSFLGSWKDFLGPLIYLLDQKTFTLPLGLQSFQASQSGNGQWALLMAASTIVIAPVIVLYFVAQKYFVEGISLSGIKG